MESRNPNARRRRRGGTYLLVLGVSSVLMIIGLAAASVARIDTRNVSSDADWAEAQMLALSAAESALSRVAVTADWRSRLTGVQTIPMGRGTMQWQITDADGQLGDDVEEEVFIIATGAVNDSRYGLRLRCTIIGEPIEALSKSLCANGDIKIDYGASLRAEDAPVASNDDVLTGLLFCRLYADAEAVDDIRYNWMITGSKTKGVDPVAMPKSTVFEGYRQMATSLPALTYVNREAIGPGRNPWGAPDADGVYFIDASGTYVTLRDTRIVGTLVVRCSRLTIEGNVQIEPHRADMPALIVDGDLELDFDSGTLRESYENTNFNPTGVPYFGRSDEDKSDGYDSEIRGLVHVLGDLKLRSDGRVYGAIICEGQVDAKGTNEIAHDSDLADLPTLGYTSGDGYLRCEGWERITD